MLMDTVYYDWLFHYNAYKQTWNGFHREDQNVYWNGGEPKYAIIRSKQLKTVMILIQKTEGDKEKLNELARRTK